MTSGPRISVCMATYNGDKYIVQQLESILPQLGEKDEIVIVDDASTDETRSRIRAMADPRIRLIEHERNRGVVRTFEDALRSASGDLIFLSDQDDIWVPEKVSIILKVFAERPEVTLVVSDAALIDAEGKRISDSYFRSYGKFRAGLLSNLIRNRYGGCTMSFRATILDRVLPFPHDYRVLHDAWIGMRNTLSHGKAVYIDMPLILNRRHSATATGKQRLGVIRRVDLRLQMIIALFGDSLRRRRGALRTWWKGA